ncbi:diguanylate cyclase with PAS/PAC and GAF sensors [Calothrix sp. NIES-4071]|nr:diguanylate cyclase with PAS/PAC and GAF sensors [Calothrix sp. NIES-4071]BAZ56182.1 diguanylate cyclase with PAS/PAC and GAF sensors [Calothrix sp. NIES-4105]
MVFNHSFSTSFQPKHKFKLTKTNFSKNCRNVVVCDRPETIVKETVSTNKISLADLRAFDRLQTPIWIYDIQNLRMWWVNKAVLHIWDARSQEELLGRHKSDISESTRILLQKYLHQLEQGKIIAPNWTFYPEGKPVSFRCLCSGVQIDSGQMAMLVEGTDQVIEQIDKDITERKLAQQALQKRMEQERMVCTIAQHIRETLDLDKILTTTVAEVRQFLQTDRVIIYRFNPDCSGVVVAESVASGWQSLLNMEITDNYFVETQGQFYQQGTIATSDIYTARLTPSHLKLLQQLQVRAKLAVPILQGNKLWGLLIVHHCNAEREWQPWESELLQQLATQLAIAIQQSELYQQLQLANQKLENLAMVDQLTQIANRRRFDSKLDYVWRHFLREQGCVSLILCDIDYFKRYNDTYGHAAGDDCLRLVAKAFQQTVKRSTDLVARYGGEEFAIILPNTDCEGATQVAQEIHQAIQKLSIPHHASDVKPYVTFSIGIATLIPTSNMVPLDLIEAADQALYQAKAQGRNRSFVSKISISMKD